MRELREGVAGCIGGVAVVVEAGGDGDPGRGRGREEGAIEGEAERRDGKGGSGWVVGV